MGLKLYSAKGMAYSDALFTFFEYIVYSMVWLVYIVRVWLVYNLWLFYIVRLHIIFQADFLVEFSYFYSKYSRSSVIFNLPVIYFGSHVTRIYMSIYKGTYNM